MASNYGKHKPMVEAKADSALAKGKGKKTLKSIEARCADNGGHIITHNYESGDMFHPSDEFVFGADEGGKVLAHLGKHLGIKGAAEEAGEKEHNG